MSISSVQHSGPVIRTYIHTHMHTHTVIYICNHIYSHIYIYPVIYIYIYIIFLILSSIMFYPRNWIWFPVLYSRASSLIRSRCYSLHPPTPNSPSIPLPLGKCYFLICAVGLRKPASGLQKEVPQSFHGTSIRSPSKSGLAQPRSKRQ